MLVVPWAKSLKNRKLRPFALSGGRDDRNALAQAVGSVPQGAALVPRRMGSVQVKRPWDRECDHYDYDFECDECGSVDCFCTIDCDCEHCIDE
jgi:hypothetical protein